MNSVTMEIRDYAGQPDSLTTDQGRLILFSAVNDAFGPLPERPYVVTYEVADDGMKVIDVYEEEGLWGAEPGILVNGRLLAVCRLPQEWIGKHVTRRVHA